MKKFYPIKEYKGFVIVEALNDQTCIRYEIAKDIGSKLRFSHESFSTVKHAEDFIDIIVASVEKDVNQSWQSKMVCEECFKHFDLNSQLSINKKDNFKFLETEQKCPNCNNHFLKFNTILN